MAHIDTRTLQVTIVPLPHPATQQPYHAAVDNEHKVWMNLMNADEVLKYDPKSGKWTEYQFPTLGAETRYMSLLERNGYLEVILPYSRARKVARMTFRTKEEIEAVNSQRGQQQGADNKKDNNSACCRGTI